MMVQAALPHHNDGCLRYRVGEISVSVNSQLDELLEDLALLYRGYPADTPEAARTIRMEVRRTRAPLLGGPRYRVFGDGEEIGGERKRREILPFVEWGVNLRVIMTRPEFVQLHSAAMVKGSCGVVFPGVSGSGKSTLVAGLLSRGWKYLSDEFALVHKETLQLHPFPKALCIKAGSFDIAERMNLPFAGRRYYVKGFKGKVAYVNPFDLGPETIAPPAPLRYVIFPRYVEGCEPRIYPITRARAAYGLAQCALNRDRFSDQAVSTICAVARGAECFGLRSGPIDRTCDLIESLVSS